ncbi:MAG: hypothetical protein ACO34E_02855 [Limisphaerales bacterium]
MGAWDGYIHVWIIHAVEGRAFAVRLDIRMNTALREWQRGVHGMGLFMRFKGRVF